MENAKGERFGHNHKFVCMYGWVYVCVCATVHACIHVFVMPYLGLGFSSIHFDSFYS